MSTTPIAGRAPCAARYTPVSALDAGPRRRARWVALAALGCWAVVHGAAASAASSGAAQEGMQAAAPSPQATQREKPAIEWHKPASIRWGTALSTAQLNATSPVEGTFSYSPAAGAKLEVGVHSLKATFTPKDTNRYTTSTATRKLTVDKAELPVRWDTPAAVLQGAVLTPALVTTKPYALYGIQGAADPATYRTADGKPLGTDTTQVAGTAVLLATFVPTDAAHYAPATVSTLLTISPSAATAAIDFRDAKQRIQGFGGSAAWYYSKMSDQRLNVLFGTGHPDSLGLSIIRMRIAPANWNTVTKTADTAQWFPELENAAAAQARGALVFASPWSPPASMKIVNTDRANPLYSGRLNPSAYADYASYLNAYIRYAATRQVNVHAISLQNEPDWDPADYESCLWSPEEMTAWVAAHGASAVAGTTTKLMAPESFYFSPASTAALLANAQANAQLAIVGGHLYGSAPSYSDVAARHGKEVWMTEHFRESVNKAGNQAAWQTSIDDAIGIANEIHDGLTLAHYNAYVHWWLVNSNDATPTGLIGSNDTPTYFGIGMKHFSYFIRPGYVRYDATALPQKGVRVSAFGTPPGAADPKAVVVLVNENASDVTLTASIFPAGREITAWTPYRTTQAATFQQQPAIGVSHRSFSIVLPAKSITTLVN